MQGSGPCRWRQALRAAALVLAAVSVAGCSDDTQQLAGGEAMATIEGSVLYRERIALPPTAQVEVHLEDVSRADAPATVLATVIMTPRGGPPYPFSISYDSGQIDARMRYALRAMISVNDKLLYTNTEFVDAFGASPITIMVQRVGEPAADSAAALEGTRWQLQTLYGEPAQPGAREQPLDLQLDSGEQRAAGFSGCNRYFGSYRREGASDRGAPLQFGQLAGTMMACPGGGEQEQNYLKALAEVDSFRLQGNTLSLLAAGTVVATFTASAD